MTTTVPPAGVTEASSSKAVLPDPGDDPLAPFPQLGRPVVECQPSTFPNGTATKWGGPEGMRYEHLYGEQGWCTADAPVQK